MSIRQKGSAVLGGILLCAISGCSETPPAAEVSPFSGSGSSDRYKATRLTINDQDALKQGTTVVVGPKESVHVVGEALIGGDGKTLPAGVLLHIIERRDVEVGMNSCVPTVKGLGGGRFSFECDLAAPSRPGTFDVRVSGRNSPTGERSLICEGKLKVESKT